MSKEFKQTFFTSLLVVLLVISNLLCLKYTNLFDLTVAVSVFVYPFTFLCTLLLINLGGKKTAYRGIIIAALIQVFITISYYIAVKLGVQSDVPDLASAVNSVFTVREGDIIASIISFIASNCFLVYIYDSFKNYGSELCGIALGLLAALFSNNIIYEILTLYDQDLMFIVNMMLSNIIVSIIMLIIITIMFYILKDNDTETVEIKNMNIDINNYKSSDLAIEDVIMDKEKEEVKKPKPKKKTTNYKNKNSNSSKGTRTNTRSKTNTNTKKTTSKTKKSSQKSVNNSKK